MRHWLRKIRGALAIGFLGSLAGAAIVALWTVVSALLAGDPVVLGEIVFFSVLGVVVGGACGVTFSLLLATLASRRTLRDITVWKAGIWGGVAGTSASFVGIFISGGPFLQKLPYAFPFIAGCCGIGAALGSGAIAAAKSAYRNELESPREPDELNPI